MAAVKNKEVEEQKVSLHEDDVGYKETNSDTLWYLDNGASNHMTGVREHFKDLDEKVSGKEYKKTIENELRTTLKMLRTDRGGEFTSNEFNQFYKENGIARQLTAPYSPQQNEVVERRNRTLMSTTRCMMKATNMPQNFWAEAVRHAIYILNSVPTKALTHKICVSRDVKFKEDETWDWKDCMNDHAINEPEWTDFNIGNLEATNEHHNQKTQPIEEEEGHKAIGLKWVFKTKKDAQGDIIKHKARLVAKGCIHEHGIDFDEVFAPVARIETIRLLLAIAANNKWEVHHLHVKSAFLHGDLKEEVYVTQPEGFIKKEDNGKVYKLEKALYGLRQAPRAWNIKLDNTLNSLNFKKCALEKAIYTISTKDSLLLIGVYVDDLIITGTPKREIDKFKAQMEEKFEMSDLGLLAYYLGNR
nr:ribonuclease H-like domain, reverse transcriptase, RNA-dependent DNA polymerase [Tanacetum cinerariifolium]